MDRDELGEIFTLYNIWLVLSQKELIAMTQRWRAR